MAKILHTSQVGDMEVSGDTFVLCCLHYLCPVTGYSSLLYRGCELMQGHFCLDSQPLCKGYVAPARQKEHHPSIMQGCEWHCERDKKFQCKLSETEPGIVPHSHKHQPCSAHQIPQPHVENKGYLVICFLGKEKVQKQFLNRTASSCTNVVPLSFSSIQYSTEDLRQQADAKLKPHLQLLIFQSLFFSLKI